MKVINLIANSNKNDAYKSVNVTEIANITYIIRSLCFFYAWILKFMLQQEIFAAEFVRHNRQKNPFHYTLNYNIIEKGKLIVI